VTASIAARLGSLGGRQLREIAFAELSASRRGDLPAEPDDVEHDALEAVFTEFLSDPLQPLPALAGSVSADYLVDVASFGTAPPRGLWSSPS